MANLAAPVINPGGSPPTSSSAVVSSGDLTPVHLNQAEPLVTPAVDQLANLSGGHAV
jgi:DNA-binding IclR family transcriptional regulator